MNSTQRVLLALGAASLAFLGCSKIAPLTAPAVKSGTADFSRFAAMGTSVTAGFESAGLVDHHQTHGFPYLFAQQVRTAFTIPSVSPDGIPPLLQVVSFSPLIVSNQGRTQGSPTNFAQPTAYNNMGVPGALLFDAADTSGYASNPMFSIIQRGRGSIVDQVASLNPTFISFEYGANEVLGPATEGGTIPVMDAGTYGAILSATLDSIQTDCPNAKIAILNIPDVTSIPYVTTFPPVTLDTLGNPVPLIGKESGSAAPLSPSDYVLLNAADSLAVGTGFPTNAISYVSGVPGNGRPLGNDQVLSTVEATAISATVDGYNNAIEIAVANSKVGMAIVDLHGLLKQAATTGIKIQGSTYTNAYITGGFFSLDGVHPTDLGYGVICNQMIASVNQTFGSNIQPVNLAQAASATSSEAHPASAGKRLLPWIRGSDHMLASILPSRAQLNAALARVGPPAPARLAAPARHVAPGAASRVIRGGVR